MARVTVHALRRNTTYAGATELWHIASRIVLTPMILAQIGLAGYGVWTLLFSVCAYMDVVHTSFGLAYTKFTAEYDARRDYQGLSAIIGAGMALVGVAGCAVFAVLWLVRIPLLTLLRVPGDMLPAAAQALLLVAVSVLMRMSIGCVFEVLAGLQRLDLQYKVRIAASALEFAFAVILLYLGWGLLGLAAAHFLSQIVGTATAWVLCRRLCPAIHISPLKATGAAVRHLVSLGGRFQLLYLVTMMNSQGFKLVVSALLGVTSLAVFEIAHKVLRLGDAVSGAVIAPMMPAFANIHAGEGVSRKRALFTHGSKVLSVISIISFSFLAVFAERAIFLWTGQSYPLSAWTVRCFAAACVIKHLTGMGTASLRGEGIVRLEIGCALVSSVVWLTSIAPLYLLWGYKGAVISAMASLLAGSGWFITTFLRRQGTPLLPYVQEMLLRPVLVLTPVIATAAVLESVFRFEIMTFLHGRYAVLADLLVWGVVFGVVSLVCAWFGVLSATEREMLAGAMSRSRLRSASDAMTPPQQGVPGSMDAA